MPGVNAYQGGAFTPPAGYTGNTPIPQRGAKFGDGIFSELRGRYSEATWNNMKFHHTQITASVTTIGLAATYVGFGVLNPAGSGVNIELIACNWAFPVAPAAVIVLGLMTGYQASNIVNTPLSPINQNGFINGAVGKGIAFSAATLVGAINGPILDTIDTGAITVQTQSSPGNVEIAGRIILPPGGWMAFSTSTVANTAGFLGGMEWLEWAA